MPEGDLIRTGIFGLDELFLGGILRGNVILVEGRAGTGKTLMGIEFIYRGITEYGEPGIIVVFETSPKKVMRDAAGFGWNLEELERQNKLKMIFTTPQVLGQELRSPDSLLLEAAAQIGARRIFIDGISLISVMSNGASNGHTSYREVLHQLLESLQRENLTAMLSHEILSADQSSSLELAEFLVDTVIALSQERRQRGLHRTLEITKSRGQEYDVGQHTVHLTGGKGMEVFRRVQARARGDRAQPTSTTKRSVIGVEALDTLMGGGIFAGSTTMLVGISGVGKTVLGVQLLLEGAKQGQRGLLVSLDEHPGQILRNAETIGLSLREHIESGMIQVLFESPQELELDPHFALITKTVETHNIERLVIDGMSSYTSALGDHRDYREFFHALVAYSKHRLMTTFFNYENPELFGITHFMPEFPLSSIVDNIILMNLVELSDTLHRAITVVKARGSNHHFFTREFTVGPGGISLLPVNEAAALPLLPFQRYLGLLSRAPVRSSPDLEPGRREAR